MRIQYQKGDPREGRVAEVEARRAKQLIEAGSAKEVGRDVKGESAPARARSELSAVTKAAQKTAAKKTAKK